MARQRYDLLVVGGGIYGASLLLAAAQLGLRAALVERADFGGGTSWNSLRILHGGLRYLQSADLRRFLQSVRERRRYARSFPELIEPLRCVMPLYRTCLKRRSVLRAALAMNDLGSLHRNRGVSRQLRIPRGTTLDAKDTLELCPLLRREGLEGAAVWTDYRMLSSERILIEMLRWAVEEGAYAANYVAAEDLLAGDGKIVGLAVRDVLSGERLQLHAGIVVNCAGPAAQLVADQWDGTQARMSPPSLAFNLLLNRELPCQEALAVGPAGASAPVLFAVPQGATTLAGTAHLSRPPGTQQAQPTEAEIAAFVLQLAAGLPGWGLRVEDVIRVFAGLLPATSPGSATLSKRETIVDHGRHGGPDGLFSVSGVKFTTARDVADQVLRQVGRLLPAGSRAPAARRTHALAADTASLTAVPATVEQDSQLRTVLRDCAEQESVRDLDDLLLRRTNWGARVVDIEGLRRGYAGVLTS